MNGYKCSCGFQFAGPGEFRNCEAFITEDGHSGVVCPKCGAQYVDGQRITCVDITGGTEREIAESMSENS